jgi:transposase
MHTTYYGIDVSKDKLQVATHNAQSSTWQDLEIENKIATIDDFLSSIDLSESHFIYEYTGTYCHRLTYCLELRGVKLSILSPTQSKGFSQSLKSTTKTDKSDARMLCLYGQKMNPDITQIQDVSLHQKRQKYNYLQSLKTDRQAFENRKHALLFDPRLAKSVLDSIENVLATFDQEIQVLQDEIFTIDDEQNQQLHDLMTTVVGIGPASATAIIVATNGFSNFENVKQVGKFLGICPSDNRSGSSVFGKQSIVKSGNGFVRTTLYMAARSAKKYNTACKELYDRLRAKGKPHKVAMMAVVYKLVKQVFAVVKNNKAFDNNFQVAK